MSDPYADFVTLSTRFIFSAGGVALPVGIKSMWLPANPQRATLRIIRYPSSPVWVALSSDVSKANQIGHNLINGDFVRTIWKDGPVVQSAVWQDNGVFAATSLIVEESYVVSKKGGLSSVSSRLGNLAGNPGATPALYGRAYANQRRWSELKASLPVSRCQ